MAGGVIQSAVLILKLTERISPIMVSLRNSQLPLEHGAVQLVRSPDPRLPARRTAAGFWCNVDLQESGSGHHENNSIMHSLSDTRLSRPH